ncbi:MAG: imidazole glycerol phosphate synthase subunit HisH [Syntrophomonadaceae bacterium]|nr:imidazole glycerol phosphate synthase subunit HisH [Syntrophomonadaceae bacterium]
MIAIIDYGMGNLRSVHKAMEKLGFQVTVTSDANQVAGAEKVILPGVGAFADAIKNLKRLGLDEAIHQVIREGKPFLGICLGLQLLFTESEEDGRHQGLDIIRGRVTRLPPAVGKVPHMGWNQVEYRQQVPIFNDIPAGSYFYFVHSYYVVPDDERVTAAVSDYGLRFTCAIARGNLFATQFHPEKSSSLGLRMLKSFGEL